MYIMNTTTMTDLCVNYNSNTGCDKGKCRLTSENVIHVNEPDTTYHAYNDHGGY